MQFITELDYWKKKLSGYDVLNLSHVHTRPLQSDHKIGSLEFELDATLSNQLRELAVLSDTNFYTVLLSGFYITINSLSDQSDILIGASGNDYAHEEKNSQHSLYTHSLPIRTLVDSSLNVHEFITNVHEVIAQAKIHQQLPFEQLADLLQQNQDTSRYPLFQVLFNMHQFDGVTDKNRMTSILPLMSGDVEREENSHSPTKSDLNFFLNDDGSKIKGGVNYAASLFDETSMQRMFTTYSIILSAFVANKDQQISNINKLSEQDKKQLIEWNQTDIAYADEAILSSLFEEQAALYPHHIALVHEDYKLSYTELNKRANALGHVIRDRYQTATGKALEADTLIGLYLDRGLETVISILAVLKAGGAYVPISTAYPKDRVAYMLQDANVAVVLSQGKHAAILQEYFTALEAAPILLPVDDPALIKGSSTRNPKSINRSTDLAYVIYTSGTTGKPKGVMIEHRSVVNLVEFLVPAHQLGVDVNTLFVSDYVFDASVCELFPCLLSGGCLFIATDRSKEDSNVLLSLINSNNIHNSLIPTLLLNHLSDELSASTLQVVHTGGDKLNKLSSLPAVLSFNQYGPTEATVMVTQHRMSSTEDVGIGKAISNMRLYVLDSYGNEVAIGSPGELHIGGAGLARGYLNRADLTADRFIENRFASASDKSKGYTRLYKTGDLVRFVSDGNLEFLGRIDSQVKIRGYRIELGEIESVLNELPFIKQAVVVDLERSGLKYLAAYLVSEEELNMELIRESLLSKLPDYMVPATFTQLEYIPLTINGKLDKRSLPDPDFVGSNAYVAPRTELETKLCAVWQEVLGIEKVGVADNFFYIGGNSITAIRLTAVSRRELGIDIPLSLLFEYKTISGLALHLNDHEMIVIPKKDQTIYPLSFAQERLLFIERYEQGTDAYHLPFFTKLTEDVNLDALFKAINVVINRHPVLKSVYLNDATGINYQQVLEGDVLPVLHSAVDDASMLKQVEAEIARPFDLSSEASIRVVNYELEGSNYLLLLWHHIAFDGWSTNIFLHELSEVYSSLLSNRQLNLPTLEISYGDYALWQRDYLQEENLSKLYNYWQDALSGYEVLHLPLDHSRPLQLDYKGRDYGFELDIALSAQLRELARSSETTLYTVLLSGFYITLASLSGQRDILIGTPSDNRSHAQTQSLIGFFVNSLPVRAQVEPSMQVSELIAQVHDTVTQVKIHQELPFEKLVDLLQVKRDTSRHPLYQVLFSLQNFDMSATDTIAVSALPFLPIDFNQGESLYSPARFDLSILFNDTGSIINGVFNYAISLFDEASMGRISVLYHTILSALVVNKDQEIGKINKLSDQDKNQLIKWNETDSAYPEEATLAALFEEQVNLNPDAIALVYENSKLTYHQVNEQANALAHVIRAQYFNAHNKELAGDTCIALYMDRSLEMVISILAVLKSGGAYVPISPEYPKERVQYMLSDTQAALLLLPQAYMAELIMEGWLAELEVMPILVLADDPSLTKDASVSNPVSINRSTDLAYVIYTSGTTGKPKGVPVDHKGVVSFAYNNRYMPEKGKRVASLSPYSFDGFVFDAFYTLLHGASVHLVNKSDTLDPEKMCKYLSVHEIDSFFTTTALFNQLVKSEGLKHTQVRNILFGGEKCDLLVVKKALEELPAIHLVHVYGPTETVVYASAYHFRGTNAANAPIGSALKNKSFYVLDASGNQVPIGSPGELYIGGAGMARGYLNRADLTAERFVNNPFASASDKKKGYTHLYKTGDLVRFVSDGNLEFIGRIDNQVKIRGHRIEPGEIESVLSDLSGIKQAVVVDLERSGLKYLAAYLVSEEELNMELIRETLLSKLPDYMVPATFTQLEYIPLTINGKLDKRSLPDPEFVSGNDYVAPRSELETKLCAVWQEVLTLERVGVHDNFFHIGGDSIVAIRVISKSKASGLYYSVQDLFNYPTIAALSTEVAIEQEKIQEKAYAPFSLLSAADQDRLQKLYANKLIDAYPAAHLQMGMLLESFRDKGVYHDVLGYHINMPFDKQRFANVLEQITKQHEVFRTAFVEDEQAGYIAVVTAESSIPYELIDGSVTANEIVELELERKFDFKAPGLFRVLIHSVKDNSFVLVLSLHHAVIDGWSVASFMAEFRDSYAVGVSNNELKTPLPNYGEYVRNEKIAIANPVLNMFWTDYLKDYQTPSISPVNQVVSNHLEQEHTNYQLTAEECIVIFELSKKLGISVDAIFLALYHYVLCLFHNTEDLTIGLVTNNRLQKTGGDQLLGLFLNTIPFRPSSCDMKSTFKSWILNIAVEKIRLLEYKALPYPYIKSKWLKDENNYQCAFNYVHFHIGDVDNLRDSAPITEFEKINIPMLFSVMRHNNNFHLFLAAHKGSVDVLTFNQFWFYLKESIHQLILHKDNLFSQPLSQLSKQDHSQLMKWNETAEAYPKFQTLQFVFEAQAEANPTNVALVYKNTELSYRELNARANMLAHVIREQYKILNNKAICADTLIGLYLDRSLEMVISILAVLKAGAAYVPISPDYPKDRVQYMVEDAGLHFVVSQNKYADLLTNWFVSLDKKPVLLLADDESLTHKSPVSNPDPINTSADLAYVLYTSGTTGKPKGVEISHGASVCRNWYMSQKSKTENNIYLFKTNYIFDVSVSDLFSHLFSGARIVIAHLSFDIDEIEDSVKRYHVNACHFVPSQFPAITASGNFHLQMDRLYFSGESLTREHLEHIDFSRTQVINYYGPTETGEATSHTIESVQQKNIVGRPFNGTQIYILNKHGNRVPIGIPGELYIGGEGLARGYFNRSELTQERFIANPFATADEKLQGYTRLYKTGDLVRFLGDGNLEFLGRIDNQVKIRGYRVEPGEIESVLSEFPAIKQAVVVDLERSGSKYLAAYLVSEEELNMESIRESLALKLPDYMVPAAFTQLQSIPLTINGKLDKRNLPNPEFVTDSQYVAPRTELETKLCEVWQEVLGIEKVGIYDNFFFIGGDSITAVRLTAVSRRHLNIDIPLSLLFDHKTISGIALHLNDQVNVVIPKTSDKNKNKQINKVKL